jgi:excisionase family DNA binding protein
MQQHAQAANTQNESIRTPERDVVAFSPRQAAAACSLSLRYLMDAIAKGRLRSHKCGRRRLIFRADLVDFLRQ